MANEPTVTQADRNCAADILFPGINSSPGFAQQWHDVATGKADDHPLVVKVAAHREASTADLRARVEVLEAALDKIALLSSNHGGWLENDPAKLVFDINAVANEALDSTRRQR